MTPRAQSYLSLTLCILLWASIPVASKKILAELTSLQMLFYSSIFSVVALGALVLWQRKIARLASYTLRDYAYLIWLGFLGAFLYYVLLYGRRSAKQIGYLPKHRPHASEGDAGIALTGKGNRAFWRWLRRDYRPLFPNLPCRTRLFRLFNSHRYLIGEFLAPPSLLGVIDIPLN